MTAFDLHTSMPTTVPAPRGIAVARKLETGTVVCDACGCRVITRESVDDSGFGGDRTWWHFAGRAGRDARGCTVACVEVAHRFA